MLRWTGGSSRTIKWIPFVDFVLDILIIIVLENPENRGEGEKFSLTHERVRGIQSSCQLTGVTKNCSKKNSLKGSQGIYIHEHNTINKLLKDDDQYNLPKLEPVIFKMTRVHVAYLS